MATKVTLREFGIETVNHTAQSPDPAPCDFWLLPTLKSELRGRSFDDVNDLPTVVKENIRKTSQENLRTFFEKWIRRWEECESCKGKYFVKMY